MTPLVSIAIPAYQRPDLLARALRSALGQAGLSPGQTLEILVSEDPPATGPTPASDRIEALCRAQTDPRFRYHRHASNQSLENWNHCLREARGRWIILLHDDDWLAPDFVRQCLDLIDANPSLRLVGCQAIIEREGEGARRPRGPLVRRHPQRVGPRDFLLGNPFLVSGVMMDRQMALDLGGFTWDWAPTQDSDCWLRFCEAAPAALLPQPLVHYFIGHNASQNPAVLAGCIVNDFKQRRQILDLHYPGQRWLRWYSRLKPYRQRRFLEGEFRLALPAADVERALAAEGWRPVAALWRWTYLPLRLVLEVLARLSAQRLAPGRGG